MRSLKGIAPEAPAHVSVRLWAAYGGEGGEKSCVSTAASTPVCDAFDGDFVQQLVSNFGHMATVLKCKKCGKFKPSTDYDGSEWQKDRKKRLCKECKRNKQQTTTAAPGIPNTHTRTHTHARFLSLFLAGRPPERERERERERREREKERERRSSGITLCPLLVLSLFPKKREEERVEKEERKRERKREREGSAVSHYAPSLY